MLVSDAMFKHAGPRPGPKSGLGEPGVQSQESESPGFMAMSQELELVRIPQWKSESESERHHYDSETLAGVWSWSHLESWQ